MMHGWPLSSDTFDDLAMALADAGLRAIAYDRRGFGRSQQPWDGYDYDTLADDLAAVSTRPARADATLLGFSMGGGEVARYMSRHARRDCQAGDPRRLDRSVHAEDAPTTRRASISRCSMRPGAAIKADRAKFWTGFFKDFYGVGRASQPVSDEVLEWSRDVSMQASLKATLACASSFATTDFRPDLSVVQVPTLIIHGTDDKTVPIDASARAAAAGIRRQQADRIRRRRRMACSPRTRRESSKTCCDSSSDLSGAGGRNGPLSVSNIHSTRVLSCLSCPKSNGRGESSSRPCRTRASSACCCAGRTCARRFPAGSPRACAGRA